MPKQINVKMGFEADTSQAKRQIQDLQKSLDNLLTKSAKSTPLEGFSKELVDAQQAAVKLKSVLGESLNINTGRLDLIKFNQQLQDSGLNLSSLGVQLSALGPEGKQAFLNLTNSIVTAQKPIIETNKLLDGMWTALKNTARWQLSSSILHGFMGAIQGAYGYAQDLDKSLNSIRIVSGQSAEQMAQLADQANRTAQALSTSTLAYTDAALIYYQQGLNADEVARRTETTLKMSNVTGESADAVSSYMTAIWNNFAEGSNNLEYFADVITALGAATAASSEEIANGMQQFAAVANTVGLSYEYAASALATIVAQTRQSESTVGNSLRTIFARFDSVKLGETLEDGVGLTKYTEALQKAGVSVLDQNGQLKEMDEILNDIGERWDQLNKTQQTALAQTVGGVRQYTNLIALFDNWDKFQTNLTIAQNSSGSLEEQQKIYEESWEAVRKRVKASWQAIYQNLIDEKFFINLLDNISKVLNGVDKLIDTVGGLKGVLGIASVAMTKLFGPQIQAGLKNFQVNLNKIFFKDEIADYEANQAIAAIEKQQSEKSEDLALQTVLDNKKFQIELNNELRKSEQELAKNSREYSKEQKIDIEERIRQTRVLIEETGVMAEEYANAIKAQQEADQQNVAIRKKARNIMYEAWAEDTSIDTTKWENIIGQLPTKDYQDFIDAIQSDNIEEVIKKYTKLGKEVGLTGDIVRKLVESEQQLIKTREVATKLGMKQKTIEEAIKKSRASGIPINEAIAQVLNEQILSIEKEWQETEKLLSVKEKELEITSKEASNYEELSTEVTNLREKLASINTEYKRLIQTKEDYANGINIPLSDPKISQPKSPGLNLDLQGISYGIQGFTQLTYAITSFNSSVDMMKDPDLSWTEKLTKSLPTLAAGLTSLTMMMNSFEKFAESKAYAQLGIAFKELGSKFIEMFIVPGIAGIKAFGAALLEFALPIAAVVAAIIALKMAWDAYQASTPEAKIKAAEEALEKQREKATEAASAFDQMTAAAEKYRDVVKQLYDEDADLSPFERQKLVGESNAEMYEILGQIDDWQTKLGELRFDDNGLLTFTTEQWEIINNELYRNKILEEQKTILEEINKLETIQKEETDKKYSPSRYNETISEGEGPGDVTVLQDRTKELTDRLLEHGIFSKDDLSEFLNLEKEELAKKLEGFNIDEVLEQLRQWEKENDEKFNQYLEETRNNNSKLYLEQQKSRAAFSGTNLYDYDKESQDNILQAFNDLSVDDGQLQTFLDTLIKTGGDIEKAFEAAGTKVDELNLKLKAANEEAEKSHHKLDINTEDLNYFKGNSKKTAEEDLIAEVNEFADYLTDNVEKIEELDNSLKDCKEGMQEVAYSIIRFDDAIQDVTDHYDDWMKELKSDAWQDVEKAAKELQKTYGNLLDIDGSQLSRDFLKNTENLELMNEAIKGNIESYDELVNRAGADYLKVKIQLDDASANNLIDEYNDLINKYFPNFAELPVHASLDDAQFLSALTDMLNATALTADQAQEFLANMGVNATVVEDTSKTRDKKELIGAQPEEEGSASFEAEIDGSGIFEKLAGMSGFSFKIPGFAMKPKKEEATEEKENTAYALKVTTAKKSAGGQIKYQQSSHGGGAHNPSSSGKSGGGGGSKEKKKTVKEHKKPEQKTDRYHDIKERIEDLNRELKRLEKTESRVYGKAKLKYMDQEISKLEKQIDLTDEYIEEIKKYAKEDQARLRGINMGATFDDNGRLNNYEEVLANIVADYNSAVDAYNGAVDTFNGSAQEEADNAMMESAEKALSNAKDTYDEYLKILDQYEDTFNLLEEKIDERIDQVWALFDMRVKQITFKIDFELDWNEKEIQQLEWMLKYINKNAGKAADAMANLAKQMQTYEESINWAKEGISELFNLHGITFDFDNADPDLLDQQLEAYMKAHGLESQLTEEEANALIKYMEVLRDSYDGQYEAWEAMHEKLMELHDKNIDDLTESLNTLKEYADELEHIKKVIDIVGLKTLKMNTQDVDKLYATMVQNAQNQITAAIARRDYAEQMYKTRSAYLEEIRKNGADEEAIQKVEEEVKKFKEDWQDAINDVRDTFENSLEIAQERFDTFLENSTKDYKDSFGKMGLDYIQEQFKREQDLSKLYLDDFQKYHELNKTSQELNKSLNNTDNLTIRQKLLDLQDDINASMQVGAKVSEGQAEIYARRLALLQAEAELLDAQNAKSAVRMTRDNEGNFSYTYTADQDQIDDAEQNYGDKFYELLQFERDYSVQLQEEMLQKFQEFFDRRNEIARTYKEGSDEYKQAMQDLRDEYLIYMDYFTNELDMDMDEMRRLRDDDWLDFQNYNHLKLAEYDDFLIKFNDLTIGKLMPEYTTMGDLAIKWEDTVQQACTDADKAINVYQVDTQRTFEKAGEDINTYGTTVSERLDNIAKESEETADATERMADDMSDYMQYIMEDANELEQNWIYTMESMRNQIDYTINSLGSLLQKLDEVIAKSQEAIAAAAAAMSMGDMAASTGWDGSGDSGSGNGGGNPGNPGSPGTRGKTVVSTEDIVIPMGLDGSAGSIKHIIHYSDGSTDITYEPIRTSSNIQTKKQKYPSGASGNLTFATGGYTGNFGSEGKLAILHEKELVLNKEDTSNMLNIVGMVRDMVGSFNINQRLDSLLSIATAATGMTGLQAQPLDQNVHIEASFPNVQSHNEIELALNNLINSASQYVNRK